jgi:putative tryptophan/tyrosine transport system substrate-binding protein
MLRREFIAGIGSAAAWPVAARAQQGDRVRRIGVLHVYDENDPDGKRRYSAFTQALAEELAGLQPEIILTSGTPATVALQRETRTIPIVFATVSDPVASGLVARLDRPDRR